MNYIKQTAAFTMRNIKLFFKDKGTFFTSLISPLVLLILYILFLHGVLKDSFESGMGGGMKIAEDVVNGFIASFEVSSLLAVTGVTTAFIANMAMVDDRVTGVYADIMITPVKRSVPVLGYYFATVIITLIISFAAMIAGFVYVAIMGWAMSVADCFLIILDVVVCVMFGTALSSLICFFLKSRGAMNAVGTIISFIYGFICGAYYPIAQFSPAIGDFVMCLPGTYCTGLFRTHFMNGYYDKFIAEGVPADGAKSILDSLDANMYFFDNAVPVWVMYLVAIGTILLLVGAFVLLNVLQKPKKS